MWLQGGTDMAYIWGSVDAKQTTVAAASLRVLLFTCARAGYIFIASTLSVLPVQYCPRLPVR